MRVRNFIFQICFRRALLVPILLFTYGCRCGIPTPITGIPASTEIIQSSILNSTEPLTLVHVWATWCRPCREEFPELIKIHNEYASKGLAIILISADNPNDFGIVETFLLEQNSPVSSFIATELDQPFIEMLSPTWSGALPSSFFFGSNGKLLTEWEGKKSYEQYAETIEVLLKEITGDTP